MLKTLTSHLGAALYREFVPMRVRLRRSAGIADHLRAIDLSWDYDVMKVSRLHLEAYACNYGSAGYSMSPAGKHLIESLKDLVVCERTVTRLPIASLSGCGACKSFFHWPNPGDAPKSLSTWGETITDLSDLDGLTDREALASCLAWPELRSENPLEVVTDSWSGRYYLDNSGGGHHFARATYLDKRLGADTEIEVNLRRYSVDMEVLRTLEHSGGCYVVRLDSSCYSADSIFKFDSSLSRPQCIELIGVSNVPLIPEEKVRTSTLDYLVFIDCKAELSDIGRALMEKLVEDGRAVSLRSFITPTMSDSRNDENAPEISTSDGY